MSETPVLSVCPFCACGCGLYLHASDGHLRGVSPSASHEVSEGKLCARGWSAHEGPLFGARLRAPMARVEGELRQVTWEQATAEAARRLAALRERGEPLGVLVSPRATTEEAYLCRRLAQEALKGALIDTPLRSRVAPLLAGVVGVSEALPTPPTVAEVRHAEAVLVLEGDLLENAVRYTPTGGTITARLDRHDSGLSLEVSDTGIGIAEAELGKIFDEFYRTDAARDHSSEGTGLGLAIVQAIAHQHEATLEVESSPGAGTTFRVLLPGRDPAP